MLSNMKILVLFFIVYINYCTSQYIEPKKAVSNFPKKVRAALIQYNNAGNYFKPFTHVTKTRKPPNQNDYTVFVKVFPHLEEGKVDHQIVPNSPYFPIDDLEPHERRTRVKKVLPEYNKEFQRHKRFADDNNAPVKDDVESLKKDEVGTSRIVDATAPKKTKPSATSGRQIKSRVKKLAAQTRMSAIKRNGTKVQKMSSKLVSKNATRIRYNKQRKVSRIGKTSGITRQAVTGVKKMKTRGQRNKLLQPLMGRSKKLTKSSKSQAQRNFVGTKYKSAKRGKQQRGNRLRNVKGKEKQNEEWGVRSSKKTSKLGTLKLPTDSARRLIASRDALIEEYPYTVSIQKEGHHWCSGAILNPRLIITTANCLWRSQSISRMRVRVGSRHTDRGGQVARIQEVMKHPGWKLRKSPDNDIALVLLDKNIKFSHGLHAVDLPNRVMMPPFDDVWVTSWGSERKDGIYDSHSTQNLQVYHARLMDRGKCNNVTQRFGAVVTENFICLSQMGQRAPCTRDTGAPAVSDGVLWGLASWGIRKLCGTERYPAVFSYLASQSNMDFIANASHFLMADERFYPFPDRYPVRKATILKSDPVTMRLDMMQ